MQGETTDHWVPAAVSRDVVRGTVVPATLSPHAPIAVWRSASGKLCANGDRCPHRGMRLSHGFVRGESLSCIYHGWRFGRDGTCQHIPAHPDLEPPKSITCGPLLTHEQDGVVWVAATQPDQHPPEFASYDALRSMVFRCDLAELRNASNAREFGGVLETTLADLPTYLISSDRGAHALFVIALLPSSASSTQKMQASKALEALRRASETLSQTEQVT